MIPADFDLLRVAVATPAMRVADVDSNTNEILTSMRHAAEHQCRVIIFPELCITGYSCGDLFYQSVLQRAALSALERVVAATELLECTAVVGLPVNLGGTLYNCAAVVSSGKLAGLVPKTYLPNTSEYYEKRWFASGKGNSANEITLNGQVVPFGLDLLFRFQHLPEAIMGVEICEDLWSVQPPSGYQALAGATILANLSASIEAVGKSEYRRRLVQSQSERCIAAYCYAAAGPGESTTDYVFGGQSIIAENGAILNEAERFSFESKALINDIDVGKLVSERQKNSSFTSVTTQQKFRVVEISVKQEETDRLLRPVAPLPFVPAGASDVDARCREVFDIQTTALAKRLLHTGLRSAVIGVSGGLDSTLALIATVKTFDKIHLPREGVIAVTMPGFGTTKRTLENAERLGTLLGCSLRVIPIDAAVRQHFHDIGHDEMLRNVTYENAQARERTQILMDIANQMNGLVVGTGDLSELALGWCTYNGDHISMYGINAGIPKTLVRHIVEWAASTEFSGDLSGVLGDIADTPVSPELLPPDEDGNIGQHTESVVGPYLLHDFFLYYAIRLSMPPAKILLYAREAFRGKFSETDLHHWLAVFYRRFFQQQFKRSCMPDGVKVGSVSLSPRGDWRMPSDAEARIWLENVESCLK